MKAKFHKPSEIAEILGFKKRDILEAIKSGDLPAIKLNARNFKVSAIDAAAWYASKGGKLKSITCTTSTTPPEAY